MRGPLIAGSSAKALRVAIGTMLLLAASGCSAQGRDNQLRWTEDVALADGTHGLVERRVRFSWPYTIAARRTARKSASRACRSEGAHVGCRAGNTRSCRCCSTRPATASGSSWRRLRPASTGGAMVDPCHLIGHLASQVKMESNDNCAGAPTRDDSDLLVMMRTAAGRSRGTRQPKIEGWRIDACKKIWIFIIIRQ